jgi:hypothetical protein
MMPTKEQAMAKRLVKRTVVTETFEETPDVDLEGNLDPDDDDGSDDDEELGDADDDVDEPGRPRSHHRGSKKK